MAFWLAVAVATVSVFAVRNAELRKAFAGVIHAALQLQILIPVVLLGLYCLAVVYSLRAIGVWTPRLLKDTLLWFALVGIVLPFSFVSGKYKVGIIETLLKEAIGILIVVEFVVATYTFSLLAELLLIPAATRIGILDVVAESKSEFAPVKKLTGWALATLGLTLAALAIKSASRDPNFLSAENLSAFFLPVFLSLSLAPFIYLLLVYVLAQDIAIRVGLGKKLPKSVRWYAAYRLFRVAGLNPVTVRARWQSHVTDLWSVTSRDEIDGVITASR